MGATASLALPALFTATVFLSSFLLFFVQPLIARMVLPWLGGAPAVWVACQVFFQLSLLSGYVYAHFASVWLGPRRQALLHGSLILLAWLALPIAIPPDWAAPGDAHPIPWLLKLLLATVAAPFFVISASAPLLQKWFSTTRHRWAKDPYFLYAASNLGSMLALLSYPTIIEPQLALAAQSRLWAWGYGLLAVLTPLCMAAIWRTASRPDEAAEDRPAALTWLRRLVWIGLAFIPSSLMLGATTHITLNRAPIPLFWILPLATYLLSFILVFSGLPRQWSRVAGGIAPLLVLFIAAAITGRFRVSLTTDMLLQLAVVFAAGLECHGRLAADRPARSLLTEFYLWISVGGALGGLFNSIAAPLLFTTPLEYPLVLALFCLFLPEPAAWVLQNPSRWARWSKFGLAVLAGLLVLRGSKALARIGVDPILAAATGLFHFTAKYALDARPGLAAIVLCAVYSNQKAPPNLYRERSFYGTFKVAAKGERLRYHVLTDGNTTHGVQDVERPADPLTYYHPGSGVGEALLEIKKRDARPPLAFVGLGAGTLAAYGQSGQEIDFYEINPAIVRVARDARHFTYLRDAERRGARLKVLLGDARLGLASAPDGHYGLIAVDAFNSDTIPVHLLTREALRLYLDKLRPDGLILVHTSNRYLDLTGVLGDLARDMGLVGRRHRGRGGKNWAYASDWVLLARRRDHLGGLARRGRWAPLPGVSNVRPWTDDYSSLLVAGRLRRRRR